MARLSIQKVHVGDKDANCYVVACSDTKEAIVIDPGGDAPKILRQLKGLTVRWRWLSHAHPWARGPNRHTRGEPAAARPQPPRPAAGPARPHRRLPGSRSQHHDRHRTHAESLPALALKAQPLCRS